MDRLNVFYFHTHDSGRYWSPYGYKVPTPNIENFAKEGTIFRQCFCAGPTCSPSRSALLTGYTPHQNGMQGLVNRGWQLNDYSRHLAQFLGRNGYHSVLCGVQHVAPDSSMIGYDEIIGSPGQFDERELASREDWDYSNTDAVCRYLDSYKRDKPLFLDLGWLNTHREYPQNTSPDINPNYLRAPDVLYDCRETRNDIARYCESVRVVDNCFAEVYDALGRNGYLNNSLIILTTDHGIAFPFMKCNLYDTGIGVALLMDYPGNKMKGQAIDSLVSHYDIFPTICDLAGLEKPEWLQGASMEPILSGMKEKVRDCIFSEVTYHAAYEPKRCIRTERYKYIRHFDDHSRHVLANIDDSYSKTFLLDAGFPSHPVDREMLFDLYLDPLERENLISDPAYGEIRDDLRKRLDQWMADTDDPLLRYGHRVPKPVGAQVNPLDCVSPRLKDFEPAEDSDYEY